MTCGVTMVIDRGRGLQMFLVSLSKCFSCLTYVLLITFQPVTTVSINYRLYTMVIDRGGGLQVFLVSLSKCSSCLTYVLLITFQLVTTVSINYRYSCNRLTGYYLNFICNYVDIAHPLKCLMHVSNLSFGPPNVNQFLTCCVPDLPTHL